MKMVKSRHQSPTTDPETACCVIAVHYGVLRFAAAAAAVLANRSPPLQKYGPRSSLYLPYRSEFPVVVSPVAKTVPSLLLLLALLGANKFPL